MKNINLSRRAFLVAGLGLPLLASSLPRAAFAEEVHPGSNATPSSQPIEPIVTYERENEPVPYGNIYYSTLSFNQTSLTGATRYYSGRNISIEMDAYTTGNNPCDNYFSVELHRADFPFSTQIGSAGFKRNGYSKATWPNMEPGNYFFRFVKCADSVTIKSNNVRMWS